MNGIPNSQGSRTLTRRAGPKEWLMVIVQLKKDYVVHDNHGDVLFRLASGLAISTIRYSYLTSHYKEMWPDQRHIEEKYFIAYIKSAFHIIPKEDCEVPICYSWGYNL